MVLTLAQKNEIITKYKLKWTIIQIAESMKCSGNTVHKIIKNYKLGIPLERKIGSGIRIKDCHITLK